MPKMTPNEIRQRVTDDIVAALEAGHRPWQKPWMTPGGHRNAVSGHKYRGVNVWWLNAQAFSWGFTDDRWLTFNQARKAGGHVRKGEKGCQIIFTKPLYVDDKDSYGEPTGDRKRIQLLKVSTVFNLEQTEGVNAPVTTAEPVTFTTDEAVREAQRLADTAGARVEHTNEDRACYIPMLDIIQIPRPEFFRAAEGYAATLFHELTHWTGHESRKDRFKSAGGGAYAYEELIAELGASMLCATVGIENNIEHHASYVGSWIKELRDDRSFIFRASREAEQAVEFLTEYEIEQEIDHAEVA